MIITDKSKLTSTCKRVTLFEAQGIIEQLEKELHASKTGAGLAANQIGINARVCIVRLRESINLVNPVIIQSFDNWIFVNEGCLSFPDQWITTARYNEIFVKDSLHPTGFVSTGPEAVAIQHEIDHLNGKTMYDYQIEMPANRNSLCWCGSKRKYKKCCLGLEIKNG